MSDQGRSRGRGRGRSRGRGRGSASSDAIRRPGEARPSQEEAPAEEFPPLGVSKNGHGRANVGAGRGENKATSQSKGEPYAVSEAKSQPKNGAWGMGLPSAGGMPPYERGASSASGYGRRVNDKANCQSKGETYPVNEVKSQPNNGAWGMGPPSARGMPESERGASSASGYDRQVNGKTTRNQNNSLYHGQFEDCSSPSVGTGSAVKNGEGVRGRNTSSENQGIHQICQQLDNVAVGSRTINQGFQGTRESRASQRNEGRLFREILEAKLPTVNVSGQHSVQNPRNIIPVVCNFFKLETMPDFVIYHYHVEFDPPIESKQFCKKLVKQHQNFIGAHMFDNSTALYLANRLQEKVTVLRSVCQRNDSQVKITLTLVEELPPNSPTCLHLMNVMMGIIFQKIQLQRFGRSYYDYNHPQAIPQHRLEVLPGFVTSILDYEACPMLCVDVSHKILRTETVLDVLKDLVAQHRNWQDVARKKLIGEFIVTRYNNKMYRIMDIDLDRCARDTFEKDGVQISYMDYIIKEYDKYVSDPDQPILISKPSGGRLKKEVHLIPEFCHLTGLSEEAKTDFHVMKDVAQYTRVEPQKRAETLHKFMQTIQKSSEITAFLQSWDMKFDANLVEMTGRQIENQTIYQGSAQNMRQFTYDHKGADWSAQSRGWPLISPICIKNWMILFISRDRGCAQELFETLRKVCGPMGMTITKPEICELENDRTDTYLRRIRNVMDSKGNVEFVLPILPTNRKDRYDAIKRELCIERPVPSQVVLGRTLSKKRMLMSVATKIAIQINCKLGGTVWRLNYSDVHGGVEDSMVIGIDVYHDTLNRKRSVAAFVASTDRFFTRYFTRVIFQEPGQEIVDKLGTCMTQALRKYHELNRRLPEKIFVYRDGVGDGQLDIVLNHELEQFRACFRLASTEYSPKLAVIVVKKRINTRFFLKDGRDRNGRERFSNPLAGSCFDSVVTRPQWYDFFLVSQSVRQGTVTPTHFNIIYDTIGLSPAGFQLFTYKLCHMYYNWMGTVRVPAPCQYAHKLAFLVGQSLHQPPSPLLSDKLYFL